MYTYDKVNNILSLENKAPVPSSNLMGGSSSYSYDYDDLYRLTTAEGSYKGANESDTYTLSMDYNSVGGITQKTQVHKKGEQEQKKTTYDLTYAYGETQPHAPIHIGDQAFTYDANGNQTGWTDDISGQQRKVLWDEENRIRSIYDNGSQHHYIYDASGERVLKGKTTGQRIFVNGEWKAGSGQMGNYTVYVNPYLVLKSGGYTKHYYIEGQRIVSKLGGGWDNKNSVKAGGNKVDYVGKQQKVFDGIVKNLKFLGADGQVLTAGKSGKVPPGQISGTGNVSEPFRYFYHPDHLGSTSYVTDASGEVYQHMEYFAFGETFVDEHSNTDKTPYLFNGKELDEETGLYYYGARYYDARTSVWMSVDPKVDKFPGWNAYNYSLNNPVTLTDPNGKEPDTAPPNVIPIMLSRTKNFGRSQGTFGQIGAYWSIFFKPDIKSLIARQKRIETIENIVNLAGEIEHPIAPLGKEIASIPIANEKGKIMEEVDKIRNANIEKQQYVERGREANILIDNLDLANSSGVFGEQINEETVIDLTNYIMIQKYGDPESLSNFYYKELFKGGNSKNYLNSLKKMAQMFKADLDKNRARLINANKLDGPPIEINKDATKYEP